MTSRKGGTLFLYLEVNNVASKLVSVTSKDFKLARVLENRFGFSVIGKIFCYDKVRGFTISGILVGTVVKKTTALRMAERWVQNR